MLTCLLLKLENASHLQHLFTLNDLLKAILESQALNFYNAYFPVGEKREKDHIRWEKIATKPTKVTFYSLLQRSLLSTVIMSKVFYSPMCHLSLGK